jgi:hypothetical protein
MNRAKQYLQSFDAKSPQGAGYMSAQVAEHGPGAASVAHGILGRHRCGVHINFKRIHC